MSDRPLRFAVIGCGALARSQHIPNIANSTRADLHVCCDLDEEVLNQCRSTYQVPRTTSDFHEAINDDEVDAICLAATEKLRLPVFQAAAEAGKPIYCEKPLARSLEEMYEIQRIVRDAGIPACVGHNRRCAPALIDAQRIFHEHMSNPTPCAWRFDREGPDRPDHPEDGRASFVIRINDDWYSWKKWVFDKEQAPHGPLLFEMTHFTDVCNWFMESPPRDVVGVSGGDFLHTVVIRYEAGQMATIVMTANGTFGYPKELYEAYGQGAAVIVNHLLEIRTAGIANAPAHTTYPMLHDRHPHVGTEGGLTGWLAKKQAACDQAARQADPMLSFTAEPDKGHARAIDAFVDEIRGLRPPVCSVDEAVLATRVAFAAIHSVQQQRPVSLDEI